MRIELDEAYMQMAEVWAQRSYATRMKVGALLVKDRQIISDGYNGMPTGFPNEEIEYPEGDGLVTNPLGLHAESNAILKCAKSGGVSSEGSTLYVTMSPCVPCCKLIIQAGIKRVVYRTPYRDLTALDVLRRANIEVGGTMNDMNAQYIDVPESPSVIDRVRGSIRNTKHLAASLLNTKIQRYYFDPTNSEDRLAYLVFLRTGRWIKQFYFEAPDTNVVSMIQRKLIEHALRLEERKAEHVIKELSGREVIKATA